MPRRSATELTAHQVDGCHGQHAELLVLPRVVPGPQGLPALGVERAPASSERQVRFEVGVDVEAQISQGGAGIPAQRAQPVDIVVAKSGPEYTRPSRPTECADAPDGELESHMTTDGQAEAGDDRRNPVEVDAGEKVQRQMDLLERARPDPVLERRQSLEWFSKRVAKRGRQLDGDEEPPGLGLSFRRGCQR